MILLGFLVLVLEVIALVNILLSSMSVGGKVLWARVVVVLPVLGMPLYFAFGPRA
jgi:hypothetical protein